MRTGVGMPRTEVWSLSHASGPEFLERERVFIGTQLVTSKIRFTSRGCVMCVFVGECMYLRSLLCKWS